jgi:sec-independent protein translocase protein TatB
MFDIGFGEFLAIALIALLVFGPDRLPQMAADAARLIRELRRMASGARRELAESLGPEFGDLNVSDLNPSTFVRRHLLDGLDEDLDLSKDFDIRSDRNAGRVDSRNGTSGNGSRSTATATAADEPTASGTFDADTT